MPELYSRKPNGMRQKAESRENEVQSHSSHYSQGGSPADIPKQPSSSGAASPLALLSELAGHPDADKLLIAALLLLLIKDGGDKRLILALGYILF